MNKCPAAQRVPLGSICELVNGRAFKPADWSDTGLPIVRIQNLNNADAKFNRFNGEVRSRFLIDSGALLFAWSGTPGTSFGAHIWNGGPAVLNQHIFNVIFHEAVVDKQFLRLAITAKLDELIDRAHGGVGLQHVTKGVVEKIEIPLPPLDEQRRIVDLLSRAEGIVGLRREAEKKAAELPSAVFIGMFGDPTTNPKGWKVATLGELCDRITDGTHQPPRFEDQGIPFIFVSNIVGGELTFDTTKFISEATYDELTRRCPIAAGDVLYSTVGSYGVPVKVDTDRRFCFQRHIAHLKPRLDCLDSDFLVGMLTTPALKAQAGAAARGVAQKTINLGEIRKYQVIVPPVEQQRRFATRVVAARSIQALQRSAAAKAEATFDALLGQAFSSGAATVRN